MDLPKVLVSLSFDKSVVPRLLSFRFCQLGVQRRPRWRIEIGASVGSILLSLIGVIEAVRRTDISILRFA